VTSQEPRPTAEPGINPLTTLKSISSASPMLTLHFAELDGTHLTDIASNYPSFRRRGPWSRFFAHHQIAAGDVVAIERLSRYEYRVLPLIQPGQQR